MVTPVTKDGDIDVKAVERIIENFAKHDVSALLMGTTGEGNSVSVEQGVRMIEAAARAADGRITVYTGLTGNCISEQTEADLRKLVDNLPAEQKEVVLMRYFGEMSFKEIAEQTNVSINTALGRMRYALINLRKMIKQNQLALV